MYSWERVVRLNRFREKQKYWKRFYAQRFRERAYHVELEVPRQSGRVDVGVKKDGERIAIEIETGKSDFIRNVQQDLNAKYNKVLVVATDKSAFKKIQKSLVRFGLLIPNRILLVLSEGLSATK